MDFPLLVKSESERLWALGVELEMILNHREERRGEETRACLGSDIQATPCARAQKHIEKETERDLIFIIQVQLFEEEEKARQSCLDEDAREEKESGKVNATGRFPRHSMCLRLLLNQKHL